MKRKPHKFTKFSFYTLPEIKKAIKNIGWFLLIIMAYLLVAGWAGQTFPY